MSFSPSFVPQKEEDNKQLDKALANPLSPTGQVKSLETRLSLTYADIKDTINNNWAFKENQAVNRIRENSKYFFSYAKKFSKQKQSIPMLFDENNSICSSPEGIANILQRQFCKVFSDPSKTNLASATLDPPSITRPFTDDELKFSVEDVVTAIDDIKPTAAAGPDEVPIQLLQGCKHALAVPIKMDWDHSMSTGIVPQCYKLYHIAPLYKKGSKAIAANYRPVSLTSHIVKIYERILRKNMVDHLERNNLLCQNQHGFRKGKSCLTQLLHHLDDVINSLLSGNDVDAIYKFTSTTQKPLTKLIIGFC